MKNHILKKQKKWKSILIGIASILITFCSCSDNDNKASEYNPNEPIQLTRFFPDSGGIKTRIVLEGSNFGSDTSKIQVYFNKKRATLLAAQGERLYALVPRLPGDTCTVAVTVEGNTVTYDNFFKYKTQLNVSTVGGSNGEIRRFTGGSLSTATFSHIWGMTVDDKGNIFAVMHGDSYGIARVNAEEYTASWVSNQAPNKGARAPVTDPRTQIVYVPADGGYTYIELNPVNLWIPRIREIQPYKPTPEEIAQGKIALVLNYKHSFAFCPFDNKIYTRSWAGIIGKFDPETRIGEHVLNDGYPEVESYLAFDPLEPYMMYISYSHRHCIFTVNLKTMEHKLYAGGLNISGWRDGKRLDAEFNWPRQIAFNKEGVLYIADKDNHCIRQITRDGIVSTAAGMPRKEGVANGTPEEAQFSHPFGLAVDKDGNILIGEEGNRMIRKLTLE